MKTEKIEKHMRKRTVVVAKNDTDSEWDIVGVMSGPWVYGLSNGKIDHWSHRACNIRKATDDERAAFFAWLVSDGSDINDGFARFGGAPRGFEEWRAAQTPKYSIDSAGGEFVLPEPAVPAVRWTPPPPKPTFTVGQRVRLVSGGGLSPLLGFTTGGVYTVRKVLPGDLCVELELEPGETGMATPDQIEPAPVEPPAPKHKRGDLRVWLRRDGTAGVARVTSVDSDGDVWTVDEAGFKSPDEAYEPTRENVADLVAKQRERGIAPEVGDLVFVRSGNGGPMVLALATHAMSTDPHPILLHGVMAAGGGAVSWPLTPDTAALTLVIRRNPLRELGDE